MARNVFPYFNGKERVFGDPLRIYRKLVNVLKCRPERVLNDANSPTEALAFNARDCIMDAVDEAFDMVPFDPKTGEGVLDEHRAAAINGLVDFLEKKNQSAVNSPTSSQPSLLSPVQLPTRSISVSGSTSNASASNGAS